MDKKYQVFVSSTYEDLREERQQVMQALLALDCIPSAMELFSAADMTAWELIQTVIDECDYYVVIVAGKYGSLGPEGKSFTQMEYEYAMKKGKPRLAFLHGDSGKLLREKTEIDPEQDAKLKEFRSLLKQNLCKHYSKSDELSGLVAISMAQLIKLKPATGWVRADRLVSENAAAEILQLRDEIATLKRKLLPIDTNNCFANGEDEIELKFMAFNQTNHASSTSVTCSWDSIFNLLADILFKQSTWKALSEHLLRSLSDLKKVNGYLEESWEDQFNKILVQFSALGLIEFSGRLGGNSTWVLSDSGREKYYRMRALKRLPTSTT
jgi:hypothetical protein